MCIKNTVPKFRHLFCSFSLNRPNFEQNMQLVHFAEEFFKIGRLYS